ncbi:MAG: S23 ribosomal protein [Candidatus Nomurabacteria bacterium GW2011_GWA1_46_11]|uniref:S23 ribosomal protein n=1 Tax=Candidatus Nomurabacteria bacterium GW2011_GWA1_46_11 TaxID=1618732 RepID=A0A0G1NK89_9BACT|nr:MAG: S23 ribosomal protein [Candidatus Nomurabacteria bacterium GW2011_GWA1_46_11]
MFQFEKLILYDQAVNFSKYIYTLTKKFPKDEIFGLTNQLRRAAVSISLNIAEGSSRGKKDFSHFLDLSRGSCFECVAALKIAKGCGYIIDDEYNQNYQKCEEISRMISGLKKSLL